jgi:hypothetical protein
LDLREWDDPLGKELSANLRPLEAAALDRLQTWLPKLANPVRSGEHSQTAFAVGLMMDYARGTSNKDFLDLLTQRAKVYYSQDVDCPLAYEPSGEDFLSPCLAEADVMRRALPATEFATWLHKFMPLTARQQLFEPAVSPDPSDPKLAHLDGLNLSRAWMLEGIASALPKPDRTRAALLKSAQAHRTA